MSDKLTQNLTEATVVDTANDRVPIYSAASASELRCMKPDNLIPDASDTVKGKVELATSAETITGTDTARAVTPAGAAAAIAASVANYQPLDSDLTAFSSHPTYITTLNINPLFAPQGFLINGKISVTDTGSGLTVAIKTLAGTDPSATDPVYCRIGDTVRTISAALSVTKADGTNWCNAGSSELATNEIDYFVYLGYNATDGVVIGFSRYPGANSYDDFSATTTNEKYCAISTITTASATDYYEIVGRFAATLSAGAGYTWSVPTYTAKNLIQRPIYETRWLSFVPVCAYSGGGGSNLTPTNNRATYRITSTDLSVNVDQSMNVALSAGTGSPVLSFPFTVAYGTTRLPITLQDASDGSRYFPGWLGAGGKPNMDFAFDSQDAAAAAPAVAAADRIWIHTTLEI